MSARGARTVAGLALALLAAAAMPALGRGTATGSYTVEQAQAGAQLYAIHCAMCHGQRLEGTVEIPALVGRFMTRWAGRPVGDLFAYQSNVMPMTRPGALSPEDNASILAFILQSNGAPAGRTPLPADQGALQRIAFDPARLP